MILELFVFGAMVLSALGGMGHNFSNRDSNNRILEASGVSSEVSEVSSPTTWRYEIPPRYLNAYDQSSPLYQTFIKHLAASIVINSPLRSSDSLEFAKLKRRLKLQMQQLESIQEPSDSRETSLRQFYDYAIDCVNLYMPGKRLVIIQEAISIAHQLNILVRQRLEEFGAHNSEPSSPGSTTIPQRLSETHSEFSDSE